MKEISVTELKSALESRPELKLLDVREPDEVAVSSIPGAQFIPMGQVPSRLAELDPESDYAVICRAGGRSSQIVQFLEGQGFQKVANVTGGMKAWAAEVQPGLPVA